MNYLLRLSLVSLLLLISICTKAQDTTAYINSDDIMAKGIALHDAEEYEEALTHYRLIVPGDSNYAWSLSEQTLTLLTKEDYEESIALGLQGIQMQSAYRASFYDMTGTAYDYNGEVEKALATYEEGIKHYPYYKLLLYNYAVTLRKDGQLKKAQEYTIRRLQIDPFHATSHLQLAELSVLQGYRAKALMSYLMYISIQSGDRETIGVIENLLNDRVETEGSVEPFSENGFGELDALIRSKIATQEKVFKPSVDMNYRLTRHAEVMMKRLKFDEQSNDFWMKFYVPFFNVADNKKLNIAMLYNLVSGVGDEKVDKWVEDNSKKMEALQKHALETVGKSKLAHTTSVLGQENLYRFWYYDDGALNAIGNSNDSGDDIGPYIYYYNNGEVSAEGLLNSQGKKIGDWQYHNPDGSLSSTESYNDQGNLEGAVVNYFASGGIQSEVIYTNGIVNDTIKIYNECGSPSEEYVAVNNNLVGPGKAYDENGNLTVTYMMKDGALDGPYTQYYSSGEKRSDLSYSAGEIDGTYTTYYKNGQIEEQGSYKAGTLDGLWKGFHQNGKPDYELTYADGTRTGLASYFYKNGKMSSTYSHNDDGELQGDYLGYDDDGTLYYKYVYANGLLKSFEYYAKDGSILSSGASEDKMPLKAYTPDGFLLAEVNYEGGKLNGPMTYYYPNGNVHYSTFAKNELWHGEYLEYYKSGELKIKTTYVEGDNTGWHQEYYKNGQLASEAMVIKGNIEQRYSSFLHDGTPKEITYYLNGQLHGLDISYAPDGTIFGIDEFKNGVPVKLMQYDSLNNVVSSTVIERGTGTQRTKTSSGTLQMERHYECGTLEGPLTFYHSPGLVDTRYHFVKGNYHGPSDAYYSNGQLYSKDLYKDNKLDSISTSYYPEGEVHRTVFFENGMRNGPDTDFYRNGQIESVCNYIDDEKHGECRFYSDDGSLQIVKVYDKDYGVVGYKYELPNGELSDLKKIDLKGKTTVKANFATKKKSVRQQYVKGMLHGKSTYYYANGKTENETTYVNGVENGPSISYYPNGQKETEGNYVHGNDEGLKKYYRKDGSLQRTTEYLHGLKHGYEVWYNADGSVDKKVLFRNNVTY